MEPKANVINEDDVFIAVMGLTGAGKSSFISLCTQEPLDIVGHGLSSCTSQVMIHSMVCDNRTVHLIDTPGFNDTGRSDGETLQELAFWLAAAHERGLQLSGMIYIHPITATRLQGSGVRSLTAFKKLVGEANYHGVIIATTRWDEVASRQIAFASQRDQELRVKVADVVQGGGRVVSLSAGRMDAMRIVTHIANRSKSERLTLQFQRQLVDEELAIYETDAGKYLFELLDPKQTKIQSLMEDSESSILTMLDSDKTNGLTKRSEWQHNTEMHFKPFEDDIERMKKKLTDVRKSWEDKLRKEAEALAKAEKANEEQLTRKTEELFRLSDHLKSIRSPLPDGTAQRPAKSSVSSTFTPSACSTPVNFLGPISEITQASLLGEVEELGHQQELLGAWKQKRLDSRYTRSRGHNSAWSVIGTGLAAAQVVAALACTVM